MTIQQKAPEWGDLDLEDIEENSTIAFNANPTVLNPDTNTREPVVQNDPKEFEVGQGVPLRTPAVGEEFPPAAPDLKITNTGFVTSDEKAPDVKQEERYSYPVTARNTLNYPSLTLRDRFKQEADHNMIVTFVETIPEWQEDIAVQEFDEGSDNSYWTKNFCG